MGMQMTQEKDTKEMNMLIEALLKKSELKLKTQIVYYFVVLIFSYQVPQIHVLKIDWSNETDFVFSLREFAWRPVWESPRFVSTRQRLPDYWVSSSVTLGEILKFSFCEAPPQHQPSEESTVFPRLSNTSNYKTHLYLVNQ